ncbi:MAG: hypothetical protein K0Q76_3100 [Panacagrimonas sp.]|nr:hypothetical protein [Panacagrimonas sp.]MCC2657992.1 hypothetical protein [Panacagrimonas sp.]
MHLLFVVVLVVLVVLLILSLRPRGTNDSDSGGGAAHPWGAGGAPSAQNAGAPPVAFVSRGKLFHWNAAQSAVREIQSPYVQGVMDRLERSRRQHGWKEGTSFGAAFSRGGPRGGTAAAQPIQATSIHFSGPERVLYFLRDDNVGGLFEQNLADGSERRVVHKQHLSFEDLRLSPDGAQLLCTQHAGNGTANIALMTVEGSDYRELTGGDTVDTAPAWIPDDPDRVVFQSAGLARDPQGFAIAQGPSSIQMAHLKDGTLAPVREDAGLDFLQPRVGTNGALYFIQRPYEPPRYGTGQALLDALLFPFRLLRAVFHYLNFFSLMYTRKPLTTASGPAMQGDLKEILLKGKRIDAEEMLRKGKLVSGVPSLVPASWVLVRRDRSGSEQVLARHVSSYDLAADNTVLFSNGCGVFALGEGKTPRVLLRDQLIADVVVGPSA